MKNQVWKKWMAGLLTAGMLFAQPAAVYADDASDSAAASSSSSSTSSSSEVNPEEGTPAGGETGGETEPAAPEDPVPTEAPQEEEAQATPEPTPEVVSESSSQEDEPDTPSEEELTEEVKKERQKTEEIEKRSQEEKEAAEKSEQTAPHQMTNEELIAEQEIVHAPVILKDFRFWTVSRKCAFAKKAGTAIREEMDEDAEVVGILPEEGLCYVLDEIEGKGRDKTTWLYVESGEARGFVQEKDVYSGRRAQAILEKKQNQSNVSSGSASEAVSDQFATAEVKMDREENDAFDYLRATVNPTVIQKDYAFADEKISIRDEKSKKGRQIGVLDKGGLCYIIADRDEEWTFVESGNVRGFVMSEDLIKDDTPYESAAEEVREVAEAFSGEEARKSDGEKTDDSKSEDEKADDKKSGAASDAGVEEPEEKSKEEILKGIDEKKYPVYYEVMENGEGSFDQAEQKISPEENKACYYTLTSPKPGTPGGKIRESLISFASQFIGNPYVWGGTSLTNGADCSGFVQSVFAQYGYDLPRTSGEQSQYGVKIPVEEAEPGDLIFYADGGTVYHVVIYAGDGQTIEAMNESIGITTGHVLESDAVWATRVLEDEYEEVFDYSGDIGEQNATQDMYGDDLGEFTITYYCPCVECNGGYSGTSTGAPLVQGRTIAVDPTVIPYGTKVIIGGHVFTAEDCGGAIKGKRIDIFVNDHEMCNALGVRGAHVYLVK